MFGLGNWERAVFAVIAVLLFGRKPLDLFGRKLLDLANYLGKRAVEFKKYSLDDPERTASPDQSRRDPPDQGASVNSKLRPRGQGPKEGRQAN